MNSQQRRVARRAREREWLRLASAYTWRTVPDGTRVSRSVRTHSYVALDVTINGKALEFDSGARIGFAFTSMLPVSPFDDIGTIIILDGGSEE